jgi:hypothetical protein
MLEVPPALLPRDFSLLLTLSVDDTFSEQTVQQAPPLKERGHASVIASLFDSKSLETWTSTAAIFLLFYQMVHSSRPLLRRLT